MKKVFCILLTLGCSHINAQIDSLLRDSTVLDSLLTPLVARHERILALQNSYLEKYNKRNPIYDQWLNKIGEEMDPLMDKFFQTHYILEEERKKSKK
jgi:hypothetical protein